MRAVIGKCAERAVTVAQCGESEYLTEQLEKASELFFGYSDLLMEALRWVHESSAKPSEKLEYLKDKIAYSVIMMTNKGRHLEYVANHARRGEPA